MVPMILTLSSVYLLYLYRWIFVYIFLWLTIPWYVKSTLRYLSKAGIKTIPNTFVLGPAALPLSSELEGRLGIPCPLSPEHTVGDAIEILRTAIKAATKR